MTVTASFAGFDTSYKEVGHAAEAQAFPKLTDAEGKVELLPLRQGFWKVKFTKLPTPRPASARIWRPTPR
ncbi:MULTISPECIES: hypothetical protein [Deinococcus]|uniref:hypothetical protein n=1 Tax=Deinococcus TaxID=1298 RepID=UPI000315D422|nr:MULTISPECIES: hypothetical protein [Deinococcus]MCY1703411.1 hypothetical protein [Deinococcus sp. SL84]